jgi:site-specific DNA-methyltransferase (adenine-specific)
MNLSAEVIVGDNRETLKALPDQSVQTVITSPPYWGLRDYGNDDQIGLEQTPDEFIEQLCLVFDEVWRVLKDDGTIWVNLGDSYSAMRDSKASPDSLRAGDGTKVGSAANRNPENLRKAGLKHKDLVGIPWRFAFAMQARGWYLRQDIIWAKPNPMPESVTDRCTKSHEYIFLLTKSSKYYFDNVAIREEASSDSGFAKQRAKGITNFATTKEERFSKDARSGNGYGNYVDNGFRNKRSVWAITTKPYKEAHFATYPPDLIEPCILAGSKEGDIVLDPFSGSGTTGEVALQKGRNYIGLELNPEYAALSEKRLNEAVGMFGDVIIR